MYQIINKRKIWFSFSAVLIVISIVSLVVWGLNWGIDFTGGSLMELKINQQIDQPTAEIKELIQQQGIQDVSIQPSGEDILLIRMPHLTEAEHQQIVDALAEQYAATEEGQPAGVIEQRFESIGPTIGHELKNKAFWAIVLVLIAIISYIAFAFRKVSQPVESWKYGLAAIIALAHDIFITIGLFSILGHYIGYQVDSLFITALLTIMGFSVHDTIVTFDRTRENLFRHQDKTFGEVVNTSINETIVRSLNTSITTLLVLVMIYLFGGQTISAFILALMFGILIGTYSSIFVASPLLMVWYRLKMNKATP